MMMLIVAYKTNDQLVKNYENDTGKLSAVILLGVTIGFTVANGYWVYSQYQTFSCAGNEWNMTVTMVAVILMYGLVLLRTRKDSSILTSGIASLYCLYL